MYCGNNRYDHSLLSGRKILGNQYDCFKKGLNIGKNLKLDSYPDNYSPIFKNKIYCGKNINDPNLGNLAQCLQKGVGVGIGLQIKDRKKNDPDDFSKNFLFYFSIFIFIIVFVIGVYFILKKYGVKSNIKK